MSICFPVIGRALLLRSYPVQSCILDSTLSSFRTPWSPSSVAALSSSFHHFRAFSTTPVDPDSPEDRWGGFNTLPGPNVNKSVPPVLDPSIPTPSPSTPSPSTPSISSNDLRKESIADSAAAHPSSSVVSRHPSPHPSPHSPFSPASYLPRTKQVRKRASDKQVAAIIKSASTAEDLAGVMSRCRNSLTSVHVDAAIHAAYHLAQHSPANIARAAGGRGVTNSFGDPRSFGNSRSVDSRSTGEVAEAATRSPESAGEPKVNRGGGRVGGGETVAPIAYTGVLAHAPERERIQSVLDMVFDSLISPKSFRPSLAEAPRSSSSADSLSFSLSSSLSSSSSSSPSSPLSSSPSSPSSSPSPPVPSTPAPSASLPRLATSFLPAASPSQLRDVDLLSFRTSASVLWAAVRLGQYNRHGRVVDSVISSLCHQAPTLLSNEYSNAFKSNASNVHGKPANHNLSIISFLKILWALSYLPRHAEIMHLPASGSKKSSQVVVDERFLADFWSNATWMRYAEASSRVEAAEAATRRKEAAVAAAATTAAEEAVAALRSERRKGGWEGMEKEGMEKEGMEKEALEEELERVERGCLTPSGLSPSGLSPLLSLPDQTEDDLSFAGETRPSSISRSLFLATHPPLKVLGVEKSHVVMYRVGKITNDVVEAIVRHFYSDPRTGRLDAVHAPWPYTAAGLHFGYAGENLRHDVINNSSDNSNSISNSSNGLDASTSPASPSPSPTLTPAFASAALPSQYSTMVMPAALVPPRIQDLKLTGLLPDTPRQIQEFLGVLTKLRVTDKRVLRLVVDSIVSKAGEMSLSDFAASIKSIGGLCDHLVVVYRSENGSRGGGRVGGGDRGADRGGGVGGGVGGERGGGDRGGGGGGGGGGNVQLHPSKLFINLRRGSRLAAVAASNGANPAPSASGGSASFEGSNQGNAVSFNAPSSIGSSSPSSSSSSSSVPAWVFLNARFAVSLSEAQWLQSVLVEKAVLEAMDPNRIWSSTTTTAWIQLAFGFAAAQAARQRCASFMPFLWEVMLNLADGGSIKKMRELESFVEAFSEMKYIPSQPALRALIDRLTVFVAHLPLQDRPLEGNGMGAEATRSSGSMGGGASVVGMLEAGRGAGGGGGVGGGMGGEGGGGKGKKGGKGGASKFNSNKVGTDKLVDTLKGWDTRMEFREQIAWIADVLNGRG